MGRYHRDASQHGSGDERARNDRYVKVPCLKRQSRSTVHVFQVDTTMEFFQVSPGWRGKNIAEPSRGSSAVTRFPEFQSQPWSAASKESREYPRYHNERCSVPPGIIVINCIFLLNFRLRIEDSSGLSKKPSDLSTISWIVPPRHL